MAKTLREQLARGKEHMHLSEVQIQVTSSEFKMPFSACVESLTADFAYAGRRD